MNLGSILDIFGHQLGRGFGRELAVEGNRHDELQESPEGDPASREEIVHNGPHYFSTKSVPARRDYVVVVIVKRLQLVKHVAIPP